ncbi:R3H domain-containing nucleic acid-binding protein [Candidatus Aquiluna sp. UB-MaderosW2red]|jgi:spoIIIJ-associated protein|uniref:Jag family protein n=1 Tax=Candidatus Aquiluna sp. UB-MaderosW2red TaxID=1855377 RepID=UPI000875E942|nr:R3H domain-containing nucleic acid-binding protein [Candidatus Aquiluna sp. UB-MaderosW2red]SCX04512.1 spoIIIJ-associated protein [Candidatus Aquiluna sp. UB-MaderosW2red]
MTTEQELEQEGEIAADFIEEFLDSADLDGDLEIEFRQERVYLSVSSEGDSNLSRISDPNTVDALQELTRIAVQTKTGQMSRLILDVGGSRAKKTEQLKQLVDRTIAKLEESDKEQHLKPMSSYDRKLVHDMVSEAGFISESEGAGKERHIVVRKA